MQRIPFNKPSILGREISYLRKCVRLGQISGNGFFTQKCHRFFQERYKFPEVRLTGSGTAALEMSALLTGVGPGDEVILPSFTHVSTANAFALRGARLVFADCMPTSPHLDPDEVQQLVTAKTRVIVPVHYAGIACNMKKIMQVAKKCHSFVVEDAAQAIGSSYEGVPLGRIGHLGAISFHETKNLTSGEGGLLVINHPPFNRRVDLVWQMGTNRLAFSNGKTFKYQWMDLGSSFYPSELTAAFLAAQLEKLDEIQSRRLRSWARYYKSLNFLREKREIELPPLPGPFSEYNGHLFYLVCRSFKERQRMIKFMSERDMQAIFHYQPLHSSPYFRHMHGNRILKNTKRYSDCIVRLPLYFSLRIQDQYRIIDAVTQFFKTA